MSTFLPDNRRHPAAGRRYPGARVRRYRLPGTSRRRRVGTLLVAGLTVLLLVGCSSNNGSPTPSPAASTAATTPSAATSPSPTPVLTPVPTDLAGTPAPTPPGQTDTAWGRIWDSLPARFPTYPGAHPTETGGGPASATLDAGTADPGAVMNFYQTALQAAGWTTVSLSGPREDGSRELLSTGTPAACQIQTTATPLGSRTIVTILFGAACPFFSN